MGLCFSSELPAVAHINSIRLRDSFTGPEAREGPSYRRADAPAAGSSGAANCRPPIPSSAMPDATPRQQSSIDAALHDNRAGEPQQAPPGDEGAFFRAMQRMGQLSSHPLLAIYEATEAIATEAGADLVSVSMFTDGRADCSVLLAAYGEGAAVVERNMVVCRDSGDTSSVHRALDVPGGRFSVPNAAVESKLPASLAQLHQGAGLASFEVLSIANPVGGNLGTLLLGKTAPNGFGRPGERLRPVLAAAISSLVPLLRHGCVSAAAGVVRLICQAPDTVAAIKELLYGVAGFMMSRENLPVEPRLSLLVDGPQGDKMLMFEPLQKGVNQQRNRRDGSLTSSRSLPLPSSFKEAAVRELNLRGTLLHHSIELKRASVVHDIPIYIQNSHCPARDVLMAASGATSLAIIPMMLAGAPIGALYIASSTRIDFGNIQETLLGLVPCLTLAISSKLGGDIKALVAQARRASQEGSATMPGTSMASVGTPPLLACLSDPCIDREHGFSDIGGGTAPNSSDGSGSPQQTPPAAAVQQQMAVVPYFTTIDEAGGGSSDEPSRLEVIPEQRLATEAMMKVLQRDIKRGRRCSMELSFTTDLSIEKEIGRGGFGTVYYGKWRNAPAAIKVTNARAHNGDAVPDAMELAVLSSVSHPNIVQLLSCLLNMVVADDDLPYSASLCSRSTQPAAPGAKSPPSFSRVVPDEPKHKTCPTFNLIVLEYCDRGSLRDAINGGIFHCRLDASGRIGIDLASITEVLLDVATAVQYLHDSANLVHGDLKLDNVLLKSDANHSLGFAPKLGDFGLSKVLNDTHLERQVINRTGAGTLNHLAPEMFTPGTAITAAVDVYAWGILMWEAFTGRKAFSGISTDLIMNCVVNRNMRPAFPPGTPPAYADLANRCWMRNPADRPSFVEIVLSLRDMRTAAVAAATNGSTRKAAAAAASRRRAAAAGPSGSSADVAGPSQPRPAVNGAAATTPAAAGRAAPVVASPGGRQAAPRQPAPPQKLSVAA